MAFVEYKQNLIYFIYLHFMIGLYVYNILKPIINDNKIETYRFVFCLSMNEIMLLNIDLFL